METETITISKQKATDLLSKLDTKFRADFAALCNNQIGSIFERLNTIEDAYTITGYIPTNVMPFQDPKNDFQRALNNNALAWVITEAVNEGWIPDFDNSSEQKWTILWDMRACGFGFSYASCYCDDTLSAVGSRVCFKSRKHAEHVVAKFTEVFKKFMQRNK